MLSEEVTEVKCIWSYIVCDRKYYNCILARENFSFKDEIWLAAYSQKVNTSENFIVAFFTLTTSTIILI